MFRWISLFPECTERESLSILLYSRQSKHSKYLYQDPATLINIEKGSKDFSSLCSQLCRFIGKFIYADRKNSVKISRRVFLVI